MPFTFCYYRDRLAVNFLFFGCSSIVVAKTHINCQIIIPDFLVTFIRSFDILFFGRSVAIPRTVDSSGSPRDEKN